MPNFTSRRARNFVCVRACVRACVLCVCVCVCVLFEKRAYLLPKSTYSYGLREGVLSSLHYMPTPVVCLELYIFIRLAWRGCVYVLCQTFLPFESLVCLRQLHGRRKREEGKKNNNNNNNKNAC